MNTFKKYLLVLATALAFSGIAFGQAVTPSTTFSTNVGLGDQIVNITATSVTSGGVTYNMAGLIQGSFQTILFVDREAIGVTAVNGLVLSVQRGLDGTRQAPHNTSAPVWFGPPSFFSLSTYEPSGVCVATNETTLPRFFENFGTGWTCPSAGPNSGQWTLLYPNPVTYLPTDNTAAGTSASGTCHARYSFAVDGGAASTITLGAASGGIGCTIPKNAVIYRGIAYVTTTFAGNTGDNLSIGLSAGAGGTAALLAAVARSSLTAGTFYDLIPLQGSSSTTNSSYIHMSAAGSVTVTISTAAATAGIMDVDLFYYVLQS
jgi:hypothetical protein